MSRYLLTAVAVLSTSLHGCGDGRPSLIKATGTVLVDGQPVEGALVSFQPIVESKDGFKRPSAAVTDAGGKFELGTYEKTDGLPVGKYKVAIQKQELVGSLPPNYDPEKPGNFAVKYKWIVPKKYASIESSGLEAEVTSSGLTPEKFDLQTGGEKPQVETSGQQRRGNEP